MGLIREPLDVDFEVISKPITEEDERIIQEFLRKQRLELAKEKTPARRMQTTFRRRKVLA